MGWIAVEQQGTGLYSVHPLADAPPPPVALVRREALLAGRIDGVIEGWIDLADTDVPLRATIGPDGAVALELPWNAPATLTGTPDRLARSGSAYRIDVRGTGATLTLMGHPGDGGWVRFAPTVPVRDVAHAERFLASGCAEPPQVTFTLAGVDAELRMLGRTVEVSKGGAHWLARADALDKHSLRYRLDGPHELVLSLDVLAWPELLDEDGMLRSGMPPTDRSVVLWRIVGAGPVQCRLDGQPCAVEQKEWIDSPFCPN